MASPGLSLAAPPPQPPSVANQIGAGGPPNPNAAAIGGNMPPPAGVAGAMSANPQGALLAQKDALGKVLNQMAGQNQAFAPFAKRAMDIIEEGIKMATTTQSPTAGQGPSAATGNSMAPPPDGGKGVFPG